MRYLIIGAGGTGGALAGFLARAGQEVALIARGSHLAAIQKEGLTVDLPEESFTVKVPAYDMPGYLQAGAETPDIVFVCLKGYSMSEAAPFLQQAAGSHTLIIPILNIYGTGGRLQEELPEKIVTDGCIYIFSQKGEPGHIKMGGNLFRVVYGLRRGTSESVSQLAEPVLDKLTAELTEAGAKAAHSHQIEADCFRKFTLISPMASLGAAYGTRGADLHEGGAYREKFIALVKELMAIAKAQDIKLPEDMLEINLKLVDDMVDEATSSMQRDVEAGRPSEVEGLAYEVVRMAARAGVKVPVYEEIEKVLRDKGL
ncbi:MAG: 2-dehydropantoate 2-reductase [Selenomonas sp.]|uniref:ketopantoate reductase family protein n=1 Tax=unclassified Selenomonas TaxID=2637378 RepID=UPI000495F45C|nr:2-dehydropantoate 2-reductase [Selenomonas sp.]SEH29162.1 ketopantoate reductase [Selenomonas ruminantium]